MKEFNVGDKVWWAIYGNKNVYVDCPICYGKKSVIVILGNDDQIQTPCTFCVGEFSKPRGYITIYKFVPDVKQVVIDSRCVSEDEKGRCVEYRYYNYCLDNFDVFVTKEEAEARVKELIAEHEKEEQDRIERIKDHCRKSYSWNVGYHQKQIEELQRKLEYHQKKVIAMGKLSKSHPWRDAKVYDTSD